MVRLISGSEFGKSRQKSKNNSTPVSNFEFLDLQSVTSQFDLTGSGLYIWYRRIHNTGLSRQGKTKAQLVFRRRAGCLACCPVLSAELLWWCVWEMSSS